MFASLASDYAPAHGSWQAVHVLASDCACSRAVADHLVQRGTLLQLHESVVLIGDDRGLQAKLVEAGFPVQPVSVEEAAAHYHLRSAPWLFFVAPSGQIRYAGGYAAERDARSGYRDVAIWNALRAGQLAEPLPAYGCAIDKRIQRAIDPLGLKYELFSRTGKGT